MAWSSHVRALQSRDDMHLICARPGSMLLKFRLTFQHGVRVAFHREITRKRILETAPIPVAKQGPVEIHVLTSQADWLNLLWALKSFYLYSARRYPLCIHNDGTLNAEATEALQRHFPEARVVPREQADREVLPALSSYPRCAELRRTNTLSLKVFDFRYYLESERLLLLDSDVLFFAEPVELLRRLEDPGWRWNSVNEDIEDAYTVDPHTVRERCGFELCRRFNSGLGVIHKASLRFDWMEDFLALPGIIGHFWRIEQTLFALCSSKFGVELLPAEYRVHLDGAHSGSPCRHYVGAIRHLMYREGMAQLLRQGFLEALRSKRSCAS